MRRLVVTAGVLALGCVVAPAASAAGDPYAFASGAIKIHTQVANWTAHDGPNGPTGQMTVMFRNKTEIHARVTCLEVVSFGPTGYAASVYGLVSRTDNELSQVGDPIEFEMVETTNNGSGDEFRYNLTNDPNGGPPPDCEFQGGAFPVLHGNVVIEPAGP